MWRWGAGVLAGLIILTAVAWNAGRQSVDPMAPSRPEPTMSIPQRTPTPTPTPTLSRTEGGLTPQIVEREYVTTERSDDDDDDQPAPRVNVNVPRQQNPPARTPPPTTTQPPPATLPDIVEVPKIPEPPNLGTPLLP